MNPRITDKDFAGIGLLMVASLTFLLVDIGTFLGAAVLESQGLLHQSVSIFGGIFLYGFVMGQLGVLTVWATIGSNLWGIRWPICVSILVLGFNALTLCMHLMLPWFSAQELASVLRANLMLPLLFLATQAPIWLASILIGWRIRIPGARPSQFGKQMQVRLATVRPKNAVQKVFLAIAKPFVAFAFSDQERRSFGILDILVLMVYFGLALALAKVSVETQNSPEALAMAVIFSMYGMMWMLMFAVPALLAVLLPNHTRGTAAVLILYFFGMFVLPATLIWMFAGAVSLEVIGGVATFLFGCSVSYISYLLVLKAFNFVLEIRVGKTSNVIESPFEKTASPFAQYDDLAEEQVDHLYQNLTGEEGADPTTQSPSSAD